MMKYFLPEMSRILDEELKITNKALADKINAKIDDGKFFTQNVKASNNFSPADLDWNTLPTVQSGGKYDLKFVVAPEDSNLHAGVIISAFGLRLHTYGSMVARTYLVDPNKSQERNYKFLESLHQSILSSIRDGVPVKEVYNKALSQVKKEKPELEKHFLKSLGYGVGIESKDPTSSLMPRVIVF
jgi:nucleosome binding factor SPN SPT16 subunit